MIDATTNPPLNWRDHIVCDPCILSGKPTLRGTRLSVEFVLGLLAGDWDRKSIAENYPHLTEERIRAALSFAAEILGEFHFRDLPATSKTN